MPVCGVIVWLIIVKGQYKSVEKVFLAASFFYITYIFAGFLAHPMWKEATIATFKPPALRAFRDQAYLFMVVGVVANVAQTGLAFSMHGAKPKWERVNPAKGIKHLVSMQSLWSLVKSVAKMAGVAEAPQVFVPMPVMGKSAAELRAYVEGNDPHTGRPVMEEVIEALTVAVQ